MNERLEDHRKKSGRSAILFSLFTSFLKVGAFTWGGGYAMLPLIKREVVEKKKLLSEEDFIEGISLAQSIPGAVAINTACLTGRVVAGFSGTMVALLGSVLPSLLVIILVASVFGRLGTNPVVFHFFRGAIPAIVALIACGVYEMGKSALRDRIDLIIAIALFLLVYFSGLHPLWVVVIGGTLGLLRKK
ncbi:MAG: chromate transporter [Candidatus Atribacteria bacterium]|nr:chromate transporter [Candidatus Atribacteria bacterium]